MPASALTPGGLEAALAEYVVFPDLPVNPAVGAPTAGSTPGGNLPRKGMTAAELEEILGAPTQTAERSEGALRVVTRTYRFGDGRVTAEFVEDVLFRYSVTSE